MARRSNELKLRISKLDKLEKLAIITTDEYSNRSDRVIISTASGAFPLAQRLQFRYF
jgi:hypothetical protein